MSRLSFPYRIDATGRTATAEGARHVADLVELTILTEPGERVNRPSFGAGVQPLVFGTLGDQLVSGTEAMIAGALTQWLDTCVADPVVGVSARGATLTITVGYRVRTSGAKVAQTVTRMVP